MKHNYFLKKIKLSEKDFEDIKKSVEDVEKKTDGEIALAMVSESSSYALWEVLCALATASILFLCIIPLASQIQNFLERFMWNVQSVHVVLFYFLVCVLCVVSLYLLFNIPYIDRLIIPEGVKKTAVSYRALRHFTESGVYSTKNHSGILIFVSYFEREIRILADKGISEKISQDLWNLISDEMAENLSKGNCKEAFIQAINKCGDLLIEYFPSTEGNINELNDGLVILEADRWV